jgi:hypothetical protein
MAKNWNDSSGFPKNMSLTITYYDTESLDSVLRKLMGGIRGSLFPVGPVQVSVNGAQIYGSITFSIPLQEPEEEIINGQRCLVYRSNM